MTNWKSGDKGFLLWCDKIHEIEVLSITQTGRIKIIRKNPDIMDIIMIVKSETLFKNKHNQ